MRRLTAHSPFGLLVARSPSRACLRRSVVCFLTLALWRTLEMWMKGKGLGDCARQLLKEVSTVRSMDVVLKARPDPRTEPAELRLRVVARPDKAVVELLQHLGLQLPHAPKIVQNVVPQNGI